MESSIMDQSVSKPKKAVTVPYLPKNHLRQHPNGRERLSLSNCVRQRSNRTAPGKQIPVKKHSNPKRIGKAIAGKPLAFRQSPSHSQWIGSIYSSSNSDVSKHLFSICLFCSRANAAINPSLLLFLPEHGSMEHTV